MKRIFIAFIVLAFFIASVEAQHVGIGTTTPNSKAALDVSSTSMGLLPPRMDSTQRNAIAFPPAGLVIYNTSIKAFQCYNGIVWYSTVHFIGEKYGGGIVFYLYDNGQHGLIAANSDQSTGIPSNNGTARITGTNGDGLNAGAMNTTLIAIQMGDNIFGNFAAKVCADYSVTFGGITYGDWYLPSKYELNWLYLQKNIVGGFSTNAYWSSTDYNAAFFKLQYFSDGNQQPQPTGYSFYEVRFGLFNNLGILQSYYPAKRSDFEKWLRTMIYQFI